ncbi:MAG TPA: LysR family transcriptional regulator [Acetobacteraceae bacterium]|nr:LysR family transcriptional regulator [Acetobacteraceae bacterium]
MDIRAVDYMLAVAEHGSLRAAAQAVGVTQPALTKAIRRIEDEAGAPLFHRTARGVHPTVYGEAMLRHARNLRVSLRSATVEIAALKAGTAGVVRIGAGPSWERAILPEAIAAFRAHRPDVRILVLGGTDDFLKLRLRDGLLDLVLAATPDAPALDPDLEWQPLMTDEYCVIAARSHPLRRRHGIALEDLLPYPWILPGAHSLMVERLRIIFRAHALPAPEPAVETDVVALRHQLLAVGPYLSFSAAGFLLELAHRTIVRLDVPDAVWRRSAGIITRRGMEPNPAAAALIAMLLRVAKGEGTHP